MIDLYLLFFLVGGLIFAGIVWYSKAVQSGRDQAPHKDYVDPLFAELEDTKAREKNSALDDAKSEGAVDAPADDSSSAVRGEKRPPQLSDEPDLEPRLDASSSSDSAKNGKEPSLIQKEPLPLKSEASQIHKDSLPVIEESAPEKFNDAYLNGRNAEETKLSGTKLSETKLSETKLSETKLSVEKSQRTVEKSEPLLEDLQSEIVKPEPEIKELDPNNVESKLDRVEPQSDNTASQINAEDRSPEIKKTRSNDDTEVKPTESNESPRSDSPGAASARAVENDLSELRARPKSKSFTQKLAEKVAQRSNSRRAKTNSARKSPNASSKATRPSQTTEPTAQAEPLSTSRQNRAAPLIGKPKIDQQSSSMVTELVARVKNPEPIEQQNLLSLFRGHDFKFHRKVHIYGLNQLTDLWRDIEFEMPSARFVELGVSIQLADRDGAMTEKELHDFQQMTLEFSNNFDAPFEFSMDIDGALKQAQLLDQIGRRYDSMAVLNVVPKTKSGFRMADIESCARDLMMSTDKNGIFMKTEGRKRDVSVLYRLACTDGSGHFGLSSSAIGPVHDLVVYMNVPATSDPESVFQQMVKDANSLATWLEGKVVDRAGRAMTQRSYSTLMQQISDIAFSMQQDGLIPGDAISKKLF